MPFCLQVQLQRRLQALIQCLLLTDTSSTSAPCISQGSCICPAGLSEALLRPGPWQLGEKGLHYIKTIKNSSHHLSNIINDILDAASMAKGKLVLKTERVGVCGVVWGSMITAQRSAQACFWPVWPRGKG